MRDAMALSQHDLLRLMESLRTADGVELIRVLAQRILQELIEVEAAAHIGAEPGEHTETRTTMRNGHRAKLLTTQAGDLDLAIPKVRTGSFSPSLLERRRRIDQALYAVVMGHTRRACPPAAWTTWSRPSAATPASPRASAATSTSS